MYRHYAVTGAVAVVSLLIGLVSGQQFAGAPAGAPPGNESAQQYAMFLYENASYRQPPADGMEERIAEYAEWAQELAAAGRLVAAGKLADEGLLLARGGNTDNRVPVAEQGALAGYFIITAADVDEALEIAGTCPHIRYGGTVSLRRIET